MAWDKAMRYEHRRDMARRYSIVVYWEGIVERMVGIAEAGRYSRDDCWEGIVMLKRSVIAHMLLPPKL
jgi:hypothetical protein